MSLSKTTLSSIQQAGQALHKATVVVSSAVRAQAEHMVATVASQPFQAEGEQAFANFKMLARLSQDLLSLEEQLKALYATASELASPEMDVVAALPHSATRSRATASAADDVAEDVVVKPASTRRTKSASKDASKDASKPVTKSASKRVPSKAAKAITLTVNDNKVLEYMKSMLKPDQAIALTGAAIGKGAGLPLGSVGVSVKKVLASGAVKKSGRGTYLLGA
jgi:hypothetical protein